MAQPNKILKKSKRFYRDLLIRLYEVVQTSCPWSGSAGSGSNQQVRFCICMWISHVKTCYTPYKWRLYSYFHIPDVSNSYNIWSIQRVWNVRKRPAFNSMATTRPRFRNGTAGPNWDNTAISASITILKKIYAYIYIYIIFYISHILWIGICVCSNIKSVVVYSLSVLL